MEPTLHRLPKPTSYHGRLDAWEDQLVAILKDIRAAESLDATTFDRIVRRHPHSHGMFSKSDLILAYRTLAPSLGWQEEESEFLRKLRMKPVRTSSGVAPVTVLTKPFPCPGTCVFCPNDTRMPKSYLSMEPGAQRAFQNEFDPYRQTWSRLRAFHRNGHPLDKVELIILGGTWSSYPEAYQIWFVKRCFDAMNDFSAADAESRHRVMAAAPLPSEEELPETLHGNRLTRSYNEVISEHQRGETNGGLGDSEVATWNELSLVHRDNARSRCRCVGLVVETRPDCTSEQEVQRIRRLGATKVQIGVQSLSNAVLRANQRGHDVATTRSALQRLRAAGFKIHAHWMPNLLGSDPEQDVADFQRLFSDPAICPDELKIYPCSLLESAELMAFYERGDWRPYSDDELIDVLVRCLSSVPRFCRVTRMVRDIPSHDIVVGSKTNNLREVVESELHRRELPLREIRSRQIRRPIPAFHSLTFPTHEYPVSTGREFFLECLTEQDELVGFARLFLPEQASFVPELGRAAIIREVHVYGELAALGERDARKSQHGGVGRRLVENCEAIARRHHHEQIAVISAVGTRRYYEALGYVKHDRYHKKPLLPA